MKIVELGGIGPGPMAGMLLADMGASVLRIDRPNDVDLGVKRRLEHNLLLRNRTTIALDLKDPAAVQTALSFVDTADALIEGFRPGVAERLGVGPEICCARNPCLVYGRITGWGQFGPLAQVAGHDINYIAITGVLNALGRADQPPTVPLALVGDFGGGAHYLAMGVLAAMLEARQSGQGQVVDAAIVDGAASMATAFFGLIADGQWNTTRGSNILDSGAPFYDVYECCDGLWLSVGPIEARFFNTLMRQIGFDDKTIAALGDHQDRTTWPNIRRILSHRFATRTRDEWSTLLQETDGCVAPVLSFAEAPSHPHLRARNTFLEIDGVVQPAPAPRFSRTDCARPRPPHPPTQEAHDDLLARWQSEEPFT